MEQKNRIMEETISQNKLKTTPLLEEHRSLGAKLAPFGGWLMPIQYAGIITEHCWCRDEASLFDICHMGEFMIHGDPHDIGLENIITADLSSMAFGECHYGFMLDESGGIIDDVIIYRIKKDEWMLVVNAATTPGDEAHLRANLRSSARMENVSSQLGKLDLQGPLSRDVLKKIAGNRIEKLDYYTFGYFPVMGENIIISRTGYTGELGYELYMPNDKVALLWKKILQYEKVRPAGLGARDTLRLEMGYPLYGQDIDRNVTPFEAGLGAFVHMEKDFIGKSALIKKRDDGIRKKLTCFVTDSRRAPRHNYKIRVGSKEVGVVTSGSFAPSLACGIGMGYIEAQDDKIGSAITIKEGDIEISATITRRPFYKKGTAKI